MEFRQSEKTDADDIRHLFVKVFSESESEEEGELVANLAYQLVAETEESDIFGFVAKEAGEIVGCITFSRLRFENGPNAFILSPVAIQTKRQGKGLGQQLIKFGIDRLKESGVELLVTYGDPRFYSKVGFIPVSVETIPAPLKLNQPEGWLGQSLVSETIIPISGASSCVSALNKPELW
ncbi:MAG: GNAT family N-acetyltransferase [Micavibrio sp. TMED27]|nr:GNAT family N-acetyltransferase [Micavibrio sp.]OUT90190.1 MAG: GNAT family N-acetyltransferase [Micavibrio sp. TMED27]|tara:strand:- start:87 stop:623 length:537 start_codon:yes stop_codon:yes gene_type:complete